MNAMIRKIVILEHIFELAKKWDSVSPDSHVYRLAARGILNDFCALRYQILNRVEDKPSG